MNMLPGATIFAQIVSLIAAFSTERSLGKINSTQDFLMWLEKQDHQDLKRLLEANSQAMAGIQALLNQNQEVLLGKLEGIDQLLTMLTSRIEGFSAIALSVSPEAVLSEQAVDVLRQCNKTKASQFFRGYGGYHFLSDAQGGLAVHDELFIEDDLATLVDLGLLRQQEDNSAGDPIYTFTRAGSRLVRMIDHED